MTADAEMKAMVADLAGTFGKTVTVTKVEQSFDPTTGETTTTETDHEVTVTPPKDFTTSPIQDSLISAGDTVIDVPATALPFTPDTSDKAKVDGTTYSITQAGRLYGGGEVAAFRLHLSA